MCKAKSVISATNSPSTISNNLKNLPKNAVSLIVNFYVVSIYLQQRSSTLLAHSAVSISAMKWKYVTLKECFA